MSKLKFRVREVKCIDETGKEGPWGIGTVGSDEVYLAAVTVDAAKSVRKISPFKVHGDMDTGEKKKFSPPKPVVDFDIPGDDFPQRYVVNLVLIEKDQGNNIDPCLSKLVAETQSAVGKADEATGNAPMASASWLPVVISAVKEIGTALWDYYKDDDIFPPELAICKIPEKNFTWGNKNYSPAATVVFRGHNGHYEMTYDWQLVWS